MKMMKRTLIAAALLAGLALASGANAFEHGEVITGKFERPANAEIILISGEIQFVDVRGATLVVSGKRHKLIDDLPLHSDEDVIIGWKTLKAGDEIHAYGYQRKE